MGRGLTYLVQWKGHRDLATEQRTRQRPRARRLVELLCCMRPAVLDSGGGPAGRARAALPRQGVERAARMRGAGMTAKITLKMLSGACDEQKAIFASEWPKGAEATLGNVRRAQELGLDLDWGTKWFTPKALRIYDAAVAEPRRLYDAAVAEPQRLYREANAL